MLMLMYSAANGDKFLTHSLSDHDINAAQANVHKRVRGVQRSLNGLPLQYYPYCIMQMLLCVATRSAFAVAVSLCLIEHCASVPYFGESNDDYDGLGDTTFTPARTTASPGLKLHDVRPAWNYDRWSSCLATNCFDGLQRRKVWCAVTKATGSIEVDASYCSTMPKPDETQWCVNTEVCLQQVSRITWQTGAWSPCTARYTNTMSMMSRNQTDVPCDQSVGERFRSVYCVSLTTNQTIPVEVCDRHFSIKPSSITYCELNCSRDCVTTTFGPWTPCVRRIGSTSCLNKKQYRRKHILVPPYRGKSCGALLEERSCLPERLVSSVPDGRFCDDLDLAQTNSRKFTYKVSDWSNCECEREEDSAVQSSKSALLEHIGRTRRRVACIDSNGATTEMANCATDAQGETPLESNVCLVRRKCNTNDLSASLCGCTDDGSLSRSNQDGDGDGDEDDNVSDSETLCADFSGRGISSAAGTYYDGSVFSKCVKLFSWKVSRFGQCKLQNANVDCGYGVRLRDVLCLNLTDGRVIEEKYCKFLVKPTSSELCTVACKSNCALSLWSPWSECLPAVCHASGDVVTQAVGHRVRTRTVLVQSTDDDNSCQHLAEFQRCTVQQCFRWKIVDRSKHCILPQNKLCGPGKRSLKEICVNHQQVQVNAGKCTEKAMEKEQCDVPCANDCVVSEWTDWSKCGDGERMRYRTVLKPAQDDGEACPETLEQSESCDETPPTYHWRSGSWNPCVAVDGRCGIGVQTRSVDCVDESDDWFEAGNCTAANSITTSRPVDRRDCTVSCPITCADSASSSAAVCSSTTWCPRLSRESRIDLIDLQTDAVESIRIVQDGEAYIAKCSSTSTKCTIPKDDYDSTCHKYFWYTTGWSACVSRDACGAGIRIRKYDCVLLNTSSYNNDYDWHVGVIESAIRNHTDKIVPAQHCIDAYGPLPSTMEVMPCEVSCATAGQCPYSPWTIWTPCTSRCVPSTRQRSVVSSPDCTMPRERLVTFEMRQCPHCRHGIVLVPVQVGQWSSCILPSGITCGLGQRFRRLVCIDVDGNEVPSVNCSTRQYAEERCHVPCPVDTQCHYTDWSAWSSCSVACYNPKHFSVLQQIIRHQNASFDFAFAGYQTRYQKSRNGNEQRCPTRNESRFCEPNVECSDYRWLSTAWSACALSKSGENASAAFATLCGMGIKSRTVKCYDYRDSTNIREVNDALCNQTKPNEQEFCELACQNECVMTQWSTWSRCSTPCSTSQYRYRSRTVISSSQALGTNASLCPHRDESQACELGKVCFEYSWRVKSWSPCIALSRIPATQLGYESQRISNDGTLCGSGLRKRELECIANGDKVVALGWCSATIGMPNDSLIENCEISCSADCILSPWTSWGKCIFSDSGTGYRSRQRSILLTPVGSGRPCSEELEQVVPCSFVYAYRWDLTKWTSCAIDLEPALSSCGNGQRRRSVICVKSNGTRVADVYCELAMLPKPADSLLAESCHMPCPADCAVTEWSPWSSCHRLCSQGLTTGVQTRSRAIIDQSRSSVTLACPENTELVETRPCDGPCVSYHWSASNWYEDERAVWCARNDGLVVEGACVGPPPAIKRSCKECAVPNSFCVPASKARFSNSAAQDCQCKSNYIPRHRDSKLVDCIFNISVRVDIQSDGAFEDYYTDDASVEVTLIDSKEVAPVQQRQVDPWYSSGIIWYCAFGVGALIVTLFSIAAFALVNYLRNLKNKRNRRSLQCNQIRQATRTSTTSIDNQLTLLASQKTIEGEIKGSSPSMARNGRSPGKRNGYIELEQLNPLNTFPRC